MSQHKKKSRYKFNRMFQQEIVACCLQDPGFMAQHGDVIDSGYFEDDYLAEVYKILKSYWVKYTDIPGTVGALREAIDDYGDTHTVQADDLRELHDLAADTARMAVANQKHISDEVIRFAQVQAARQHLMRAATFLDDEKEVTTEGIEEVLSGYTKVLSIGGGVDHGVLAGDYIMDPWRLRAEKFSVINQVPTGYSFIDNATSGGLGSGEIGIVAGESGLGKSQVLVNIGTNAMCAGKNVLYITLELSEVDVQLRWASKLSGIPMWEIDRDRTDYTRVMKKLLRDGKLGSKYFRIKGWSPGEASTAMLRAYINRVLQEDSPKFDLIVVDYADEVSTDAKYGTDNTYGGFGQVYSDLIQMGKMFRAPVWTASQVNREGYGKRPGRHCMADSLKKLAKSDFALFLYTGGEYGDDETKAHMEKESDRMWGWVGKNRRGPSFRTVRFANFFHRASVEEYDERRHGPWIDPIVQAKFDEERSRKREAAAQERELRNQEKKRRERASGGDEEAPPRRRTAARKVQEV